MKKVLFGVLFGLASLAAVLVGSNAARSSSIDNTPDCDNVAIIKCGAFSTSELRSDYEKSPYGDIAKVYSAFGISKSDLNGTFVNGVVWRNGNVTLGNDSNKDVVATGAITAGRNYGGTPISGTKNAAKFSTSKFVTPGQTAFLKFDSNGVFQFAIIKSCGNPVTAKPVKPEIACKDLVATPISRTKFRFDAKASATNATIEKYGFHWDDGTEATSVHTNKTSASAEHTFTKPGTYDVYVNVTFKFKTNGEKKMITSTACKVRVTVKPAPTYSCSGLTSEKLNRTDYKFVAKADVANGATVEKYVFSFGDGKTQTVTTSATSASGSRHYGAPGTYTASVAITFKAEGKTYEVKNNKCKVTVKVEQPPVVPVYTCDSLKATQIDGSRTKFRFDAKASAKNATISKYVFTYSNGQSDTVTTGNTSASAIREFTTPGTYTAKVTVYFKVNGQDKTATGKQCETTFKVTPPPVTPVYSCDSLTAKKLTRTNFEFTAKATAKDGATITGYKFNYGDNTSETVPSTSGTAIKSHTYTKPGTYNATVTVLVSVNGQVKEVPGTKCATKVTVENPPVEPKPGIKIEKKVDGVEHKLVNVDQVFTYQIAVTNTGDVELKNAVVTDPAPAGVTFLSASAGSIAGNKWTYTIPSLKVGETKTFTIQAKHPAYLAGIIKNTVCVDAPEVPGTPDDCDDATTEVPEPEKVIVCNPETGEIITVNKGEEGNYKPVGDEACKKKVQVCNPETGETITVNEDEAGNYLPVGDAACEEEETPEVLPSTGPASVALQLLGVTSLAGAATAYIRSRKA